ncbi:MAG: LPS-assembly protein LptD [Bacteroidetes bacterium]|nr:LPS-assembly protein LptD [Bacteroidota bacterium]
MRNFFIITLLYILIFGSLVAEDLSETLQNNNLSPLELRGYELDIAAATESSLLAWIQRLGLPESDTAENMQKLLYSYYGIEEPEIKTEITQTDSVTIVSADNLSLTHSYGSIVLLSGNVIVELTETQTGDLYTIDAQQIVLNNSTNIITASGSVHFIKIKRETGEKLESFNCSKFSLSVKSWDGIISNVATSSNRGNSSGEDLTFSLTGDSVYKSSKGVLILDNGIISSDYEDPHISIHADTISILSEGDWFADQAFLYLGRVPVFYLPFFFYPGVDFFFNPSFGFSADRGMFVNTTTMIFGTLNESEAAATSFTTFLQVEEQTKSIVNGIQGTILDMYSQNSEILDWANETESYFAVNFDVYEQVGVALGVDAKLHDFSFLQNFNIKTLIAINPDSSNPIFRFLIEPDIKIDTSGFLFSISLPFYSDEQVSEDYMQRKTQFELGDLTGIAQFPSSSSDVDSFIWKLKGSINPDFSVLIPIVEKFELSNVSSQVEWDLTQPYTYEISSIGLLTHSAKISGKLLTGTLTKDSELINNENSSTLGVNSGSYEPIVSGLSGDLFTLKHNKEIVTQSSDMLIDLPGIKNPLILPDKAIPVLANNEIIIDEYFQYQLSYSIKDSGNIDIIFENGDPQYQKIVNRLDTNFLFTGTFFDNILSIRNVVKPSGYIQQHNKISDSILNWSSFIDQDRERTKFVLNNELTAGIPVYGISYILKTRLFTYEYDYVDTDYSLSTFVWNEDNVLQHSLSASIPISVLSSTLTVSMTLPPDNLGLNPRFETKIGDISASFYTSFAEDNLGIWQYDPLTFRFSYSSRNNPFSGSLVAGYDYSTLSLPQNIFIPLTLQPNISYSFTDTIRLSQKLFFDFGGNTLEQGISRVDIGRTYAELLFLFDETAAGGSGEIIPAIIKVFSDQTLTELSFWKNRIVLSTDIISNWNYNFQNPGDNLLSVSFKLNLRIEEFLDISIVSKSRNSATHHYFDGSSDYDNILVDLLKSFNFFNIDDRYASNFNLSEIEMHITHYMKDWNLNFDYSGEIALNEDNEYEWSPLASIYISWKAVPEIDISASIEHDTITGIQ